jgi:pimeloyl-ACP methyl ester carboxylesterase
MPTVNMTRRSLLAGGTAVLACGALGGFEVLRTPERRYKVESTLGLAPVPDLHLPDVHGPISEGMLTSQAVGHPVPWMVSEPPGGAHPIGLVVSLHAMGGNQRSPFDEVFLPQAAAHVGAPLVIAATTGGPDTYWHRRSNGTDAGAMVLDEFIPFLHRRFGPLPVLLQGWSMGGYGALLLAERSGDLVTGVAVAGPAVFSSYAASAPGAFDSASEFAANDVTTGVNGLQREAVRIDCGTGDPFYPTVRHLSKLMAWPHVTSWPAAGHLMGYFRSVAPAHMTFLAEAAAKSDSARTAGSVTAS